MLETIRKWDTPERRRLLWLALLSFVIVSWQNAAQIRRGFNLADESFLWYGGRAVLHGQVPIRDFMSYDPARYYWTALVMRLIGSSGIIAMRIACAILEFITVFLATALVARTVTVRNSLFALIAALVFTTWIMPEFKVADMMQSVILMAIFSWAAAAPSVKRFFVVGVVTGFSAWVGRNHGVYGLFAGFMMLAYLRVPSGEISGGEVSVWQAFLAWVRGNFLGFLPGFAMLLIPGFAAAFWDAVMLVFKVGTNLPRPIPWPWVNDPLAVTPLLTVQHLTLGIFFILILGYGLIAPVVVFRARKNGVALPPVFVASAFLALPYVHYAYSRADITHMALGIFPALIGTLCLLGQSRPILRYPSATALLAVSVLLTAWFQPLLLPFVGRYIQWRDMVIGGDALIVDSATAKDCAMLEDLASRYAEPHQSVLVVPFWPGAYPLLDRSSPITEIYVLFPQDARHEEKEIEDMRRSNPALVVIYDLKLDYRGDLLFQNTHPLLYQYILANYTQTKAGVNNPRVRAFVRNVEPAGGLVEAKRL